MMGVKEVKQWVIYMGGIRGEWSDGTRKLSSKIVAREGSTVTTNSGTQYRLTDPEPDEAALKRIDEVIKWNKE